LRHFIINTKNYLEASGENLGKLGAATQSVSQRDIFAKIRFYLAPSAFGIDSLIKKASFDVIAQHVDTANVGSTTGFLVPEIAKSFGAIGSLVNHSEHRISFDQIEKVVTNLRKIRMVSVVCARDNNEVANLSKFSPDFIAIEPPDLIGSGMAVSKVRPDVITSSRRSLDDNKPSNSNTKLLCGAGIVEGVDARLAIEMGAEGILVASGVIKAVDWASKIEELANGLNDAA
jgi:triosephosphate isomerase (TIM)